MRRDRRRIQGSSRARGSGEARFERRARRSSERARSHLQRARGRRIPRRGSAARWAAGWREASRGRRIGLFALSLAAGVALAGPISDLVARRWFATARASDSLAIQGGVRVGAREIARAAGLGPETELSLVDVVEIERRLVTHPWIRGARALRLPTGALVVRVVERVPRAVLASGASEDWRLVDEHGRPFAPASPSDLDTLPHLRSASELDGAREHDVLSDAVGLLGALAANGVKSAADGNAAGVALELPGLREAETGWLLRLRGGELEVVLGHRALEERIARLAFLLRSRVDLAGTRRHIDLRFSDRAILSAAHVSDPSHEEAGTTALPSSG